MDAFNVTIGNTTYPGNTTEPTVPFNIFGYTPNKSLELAVVVFFILLTLVILVQNLWKRTWFMMALVIGGLIEVLGFGGMIYTTNNMSSVNGYIIYLVSVLIAPTVLAAADYALAGHIMLRGEAKVCCFTPKVTKYLFLICDIIAFFTQGVGGVIVGDAKTLDAIRTGANIVLYGQCISLIVFVSFLLFAIVLHRRIIRNLHDAGYSKDQRKWTRIFWVVYWNMLLLAIRAFYRVAEFNDKLSTPPDNTLSGQGYFYGLDTFLMILLMLSWAIFHPFRFGMHTWRQNEAIPMDDVKKGTS